MSLAPHLSEPHIVLAAAESARTMAGRERCRLVEKKQLGEPARLQQRTAQPSPELELTRDPALSVVASADPPALVVQAAAVPVDETPRRICDEVAERRHAVLQRHQP